uniref:Putative secreted protein n=1 Tax=Amblyomma americanum TaxID=6943 RepID=A0A0C9RVQ5_AMBAM
MPGCLMALHYHCTSIFFISFWRCFVSPAVAYLCNRLDCQTSFSASCCYRHRLAVFLKTASAHTYSSAELKTDYRPSLCSVSGAVEKCANCALNHDEKSH